jgi:septal ring factor EnvC (AmiA/AmiB activator)
MRIARLAVALSFAGAFAAIAATPACSNKPAECKAIIDTIDDDDAALKGVDLDTDDYKTLSVNLKKAADIVDKLAKDLAAQSVKDATLAKASTDYQDFAKQLATELRSFSDLVQKLGETLDKLSPMAKSLTAGLHKLQTRCKATEKTVAADCGNIDKVMANAPDQDAFKFDKDLKDDADAFAKFAADLKALTPADAELKAGLAEVVSGVGTLEGIMRSLSELKPKFDASHASLKAVFAKEAPIERHINETCATK